MAKFYARVAWMALWSGFLLATGLFIYTGAVLIPSALRERAQMRDRMVQLERKLAADERAIEKKKAFLEKLSTDPEFLERVAREKLRYAKPDEWILRFEPSLTE